MWLVNSHIRTLWDMRAVPKMVKHSLPLLPIWNRQACPRPFSITEASTEPLAPRRSGG